MFVLILHFDEHELENYGLFQSLEVGCQYE